MDDPLALQPEGILAEEVVVETRSADPKGQLSSRISRIRERLQVYLANFRLWRLRRPFWGSIWLLVAGALVLLGPVSLMRFALFPGNTIWAGLLVGALIVVMGLIQLFLPAFSVITGSIAVVLSLVSLIVAAGGFIIGMLLGIVGGALSVAWRPNARPLPSRRARRSVRLQIRWPERLRISKASKVSE
jgi:hypothetical protein